MFFQAPWFPAAGPGANWVLGRFWECFGKSGLGVQAVISHIKNPQASMRIGFDQCDHDRALVASSYREVSAEASEGTAAFSNLR